MFEGYEIKERSEGSANILKALAVREACKGGYGLSNEEATQQHMGMLGYEGDKELVQQERELLKQGGRYFVDGYRLKQTGRKVSGLSHDVPAEAIAWVLVPAGHIATAEADRLVYIIAK